MTKRIDPGRGDHFGERLYAGRKAARLSQEAVAERVSEITGRRVRQSMVSAWESHVVPDDEYTAALAAVIRAPIGWLRYGESSGAAAPLWWTHGDKVTGAPKAVRVERPDDARRRRRGA